MEKNTFVSYIDNDGIIYSQNGTYRDKSVDIPIGEDNQRISGLKKDRDDCYSKAEKYLNEQFTLYEILQKYPDLMQEIKNAGITIRQRPKTQEQKDLEQAEINKNLISALTYLTEEIKGLKENKQATTFKDREVL